MTPATYSIGIVHYGNPELTAECVASTLGLDPAPLGRFVVDNGPRPGHPPLPDVVHEHCVVIEPDQNLGYGGGANAAFEAAQRERPSDYFWLLNNDTRVASASIVPLLEALDSDPGLAMVGPRLLDRSGGAIWHDGGTIRWPDGRPESPNFGMAPAVPASGIQPTDFVCGCAPLLRSAAWRAVDGFDAGFFLYFEDTDLSYRLRGLGWRIGHVPSATVFHHGSAAVGEGSELARYYQLRNRIRFVARHGPPGALTTVRRKIRLRAYRCALSGRWRRSRSILHALRDA